MKKIPLNILVNLEKLKARLKARQGPIADKIKTLFSDRPVISYLLPALIIIIYLCFFFLPQARSLLHRFLEGARLRGEIIQVEKVDIDTFKNQIEGLKQKFEHYEKKLPGKKEVPSVLRYLSQAAKKLDVRITEIKPLEEAGDKRQLYYSVPIMVKAECGYHALGRFLNELEKADRFMKIADLKMVANTQKPATHYVQLLIVTYVMGQK